MGVPCEQHGDCTGSVCRSVNHPFFNRKPFLLVQIQPPVPFLSKSQKKFMVILDTEDQTR